MKYTGRPYAELEHLREHVKLVHRNSWRDTYEVTAEATWQLTDQELLCLADGQPAPFGGHVQRGELVHTVTVHTD